MYHLAKGLYRLATSKEEYSVILLGLDNAGKTTFHEQAKSLFLPEHPDPKLRTVPTVGQNVSTLTLPDMYLKIWDVGGQLSLRRLWQSYYASCHAIVFILDSTDIGDGELILGGDEEDDEEDDEGEEDEDEGAGDKKDSDRLAPRSTSTLGGGRANGKDGGSRRPSARRGRGASSSRVARTSGAGPSEGRLDECRAVLEDVLQNSETEGVPLLILANKQDREDCVEVVRIKEGLVKKVFEGEKASSIRDSRVLPVSALTGTGVREAVDWVRSRVKWNTESRPPVMR